MKPPALAAGPAAPVRAAPGASADLLLPPPKGTQPFSYQWSRAGASLDDRFTTSEDAGGVRLTVSSAQTGDSGVYTLQASNAAGSSTSKIRLEVAAEEAPTGEDPPTFLRRLQDLTVKVGSRTRFLVEIISSTECKVTWYRNERRLLEAERVALARDGNFWCADVAAVSVDDAGRWTCTAENAGGRASCSAHLNVLVPKAYKRPEFVEELRALLTEQGTVSLECKVVGVPTPVLRWFKDSREIKAGDVFALTANAEDPTSLGTYTCEAVNCMGRAYSSSKVHVVSREGSARPTTSGMTPEPPPIFTKELEDAHVNVCESLTLGCHIVVPPWPRGVVWYNKEGKVEPSERYHVMEDGVGGYLLEIPSAEWADEGEWKCVATSAGGRVGITTCYVTMDVPKNYRKPRFMENLQAVLTEEGLVSFECKVVGFPTPVLSWFKDGQELKPGDVYQLTGTNSLGSYCCMARNCMGQASSSAELTVEDIQNQLNEEEKLQLFSKNQAPKFLQGLKSVEAKIDEPFRFTIKVAIPPEPSVLWYRDDQPVDESTRCHLEKEDKGFFNLDIQNLEFLDQAEWKCVAMNDFGHSVTSCFLKLIIPRHYKKPRFLENLQAILSDEGAVNLECKVIGVPQPVLKWYKDGEELKPGDIHRIISGQDGTCCLGTYTCEAQNCMGIAASSASLLGFDDSVKTKTKPAEEQPLQRNLSLSTIHEERTSQMYDTPVGDITQLDDKGEISFSFDGKEVSVSLYETPDLTEEEALQIVEMYADQLSENVTEQNVVELPPLRFVKETSTSGNLLMEAIIIDVSPDYFATPEEDLRTEADVEDLSIADENGLPQLSLDQDFEIGGKDYLEKTMALLSEEKSDFAAKLSRRKSDSQRSADDFFSLSRDQSLSEDKRDDDTHVSESEVQSFASARSSAKMKSFKPSGEEGQESSEPTKTVLLKEETVTKPSKNEETKLVERELEVPIVKPKRERRSSRSSRRSSTSSEKSISKSREELLRLKTDQDQSLTKSLMSDEEFKNTMNSISTSLTKVINDVQFIERDIILKSELMSSAATASRSLEIIGSLITPLSDIHSIADAAKESISESREVTSTIFNSIPQPLKALQQSLTIIEKCIDMESDNKTLVKKTCVAFIETCGTEVQKVINDITSVTVKNYIKTEDKIVNEIDSVANEMITVLKFSAETIHARNLLSEASEIKHEKPTQETKHLRDTQKAVFDLKNPLNSLLRIVKSAESGNITDLSQIKQSEVIMNAMSASIQDLQTALEQIEFLSVKESSTNLHKYNTEIIETVMDPILKLRGSFELLSTEPHTKEDKTMLQETLKSLKENLTEVSYKIEAIDKNVGQFDILQSENKLDVLQKMAQILIALENNLPRLETMTIVKSHMDTFHKNLTKVLEKVIESNDANKYLKMMEICDTVNIINSSLKNIDVENVLPLASLSNTLKIIEINLIENIFEPELNCSIISNISNVLVGIQEAINKTEEISLQIDSEYIQDLSTQTIDEEKVNIILEHIDQTIAAVNTIKTIECTQDLKLALTPALENICPILEDLKRSVASVRPSGVEQDEHISEILDVSFVQTIATPLCELNQNIIVLNQLIVENIDYIKDSVEVITAIAEPLRELHTTIEILQHDVISQYGDDLTPYEVSVNMASVVQNLQSCMVMIHEQVGIEGTEEMSTLEDISGIKTSADALPLDCLVLPEAEETAVKQSLLPFTQEIATTATAQTLQLLNEHIMVLQTPEVIEALDSLSEISDYSSLKSVIVGLGDLHSGIEGILHPVPIEGFTDIDDTTNLTKLAAISEPMQIIHQGLSVFDTSNIPVYENILDIPTEKVHSVFQSISELKHSLEECMCAVLPAMEIANNTIEISNKVSTLREVCKQLNEIFATSKDAQSDIILPDKVQHLEIVVNNLIDATDKSKDIKIDQVKCITEELYLKVMGIQDDIIHFTAQSPEKISQEAKLIQIVSEVETNIAVLEQYNFVDLSRVSDITTCMSPQIAAEIDSESLAQIDDIAEDAVNVLQDYYQEIPIADLMIVEDFFKTCKNKFTILRCLISKATSHKKIIRLLQEFNSLQILINNFTTKRLELSLSDDVNECITNFLIHADDCLRNARNSLFKVVDLQSDLLIKTPLTRLESIQELKYSMENASTAIVNVVKTLQDIAETLKPLEQKLKSAIIEELSQPNQAHKLQDEEKSLTEKMDHLSKIIDSETEFKNLDDSFKVFEKLAQCIDNHHGYKSASGTGKTLIILKCLAECVSIFQEEKTVNKISINETEVHERDTLKEVLAEMLQPLQALQTQLVSIREQVLSGTEDDSISIDITATETIMQTMAELHKDIVQQIEVDKSEFFNENIALIEEVDKEIHTIQDSINSMENVQVTQAVKEITKPMAAIEKSLHTVISLEKEKETLLKDTPANLMNDLDQYIELIEIVEEISAVIKIEDVNETFDIARKLRENIAECKNEQNKELISVACAEQTRLAQKLQTALTALQVQVLDSVQELALSFSANTLQRIAQVTAQLQANLVALTGIQTSVQAPSTKTTKPAEIAQKLSVSATTSESFEAMTEHLEQVGALDVDTLKKDITAITENIEKITAVSPEVEVIEVVLFEQESSNNVVEFAQDSKVKEAEADSSSIRISSPETELPLVMAKTHVENVVDSHALITQELPLVENKLTLSTAQENLLQHISEYVSEDIIKAINEVSSVINAEELQHSINIANELQKCIAATIVIPKEENKVHEFKDQLEQQGKLAVDLKMALSVLNQDTLEHLHDLIPSVNKETIDKIVKTIESLKTDLTAVETPQQDVLKHSSDDITQLETAQYVKESISLEHANKIDNKAIDNDSTNLEPVATTSKAAVETASISLVSIGSSNVLTETPSVVQEIAIKQDEKVTVYKYETSGIQETIVEEQTVTVLQEEIKSSLQSKSDEQIVKDIEPLTKTVEVRQQETSVDDISKETLCTQEVLSIQTTQEMFSTAAKATEDKDAISALEVSEEVLKLEAAELDQFVAAEEKVARDSETSTLITQDEKHTVSHKAIKSDVISKVPTEMLVADQSTESTADDKLQITQATSAKIAVKETLTQTINAFLSDVVLHTVCDQPINTDEFNKAVQIAKGLLQYVITSKINTSDELKNKLHDDFEQADLTQRLQQALSIVEVQLLDNVSETSPTLNYELQEVVNVILQLTDQISEALFFETIPKTTELDSNKSDKTETQHTEVIVENIDANNETTTQNLHQEDKTEKLHKDTNKILKSIQILEDQSSLEVEHIFVDCCDEFVDNSKKTGGSIPQNNNLETKISETVLDETTKPFEEFFDSPTLPDELPSTELIAIEVGETTILEHMTNAEKYKSDTTESAQIRLCDSFISAVTLETNITENTETINYKGSSIEEMVIYPEVKIFASELATSNQIIDKDNTIHQKVSAQELVSVCYDVEPVMQSGIGNQDGCFSLETLSSQSVEPINQLSLAINTKRVTELKILENPEIIAIEDVDERIASATLSISDSLTSAVVPEKNIIEIAKLKQDQSSNHETKTFNPTIVKPLFATVICEEDIDKVLAIDQVNTVHKSESHDLYPITAHEILLNNNFPTTVQEVPIILNQTKIIECVTENIQTDTPLLESFDLQTKAVTLPLSKIISTETVETTTSNDNNNDNEMECKKTATVSRCDINTYAGIDEGNVNEATKVRKQEISNHIKIPQTSEGDIPQLEVAIKSQLSFDVITLHENKIQESIAETALAQDVVIIEKKLAISDQPCFVQSPTVNIECSNLIQHIDAFISDEVTEIVNEISNVTHTETLKDSVAVAKKLRECILATDYRATAEETRPIRENFYSEQANLAHILQNAFSVWHIQALDIAADVTEPIISPQALQKISEIILHIEDDLAVANVSYEAENIKLLDIGDEVETKEQNSIAQLESLLQDVNIKIHLAPVDGTMDTDNSESLKDTLDEVQTVIIKLKQEYDGTGNYTLNETLEDLECSVRSVQLQINEESPPELLTEACATLQLLVDNINATQETQNIQVLLKSDETILEKCSNETEETVKLLEMASKIDIKGNSSLANIVNNLKNIKDNIKSLRVSFLVNAETLIENGVKVIECLNQVEENIFSLEREVEIAENITIDTRDSIITAVHSVYGSISNMRSTVYSLQKRFMFENYGKPSESLLHSIKNVAVVSSSDDEENKPCWKRFSKSLRKVLNHFEDIKFYINLDKTARLPSDAAFTKIILEELKDNIISVLVPRAKLLDSNVLQKASDLLKCVETNLTRIESHSSLEVKNKIPMFKNFATKLLTTTTLLKNQLEISMGSENTIETSESLDAKKILKDEYLDSNQEPQELTITTPRQQVESFATVEVKPIEESILTTDLVAEEISKTTIKYVTEAEILFPLEKQASIVEANTDCSTSKPIENMSPEIKHPLPSLEKTILLDAEQNQTKTVEQSKKIDELPQSQIPAVVLKTTETHDLTLQATTSKQGYDKFNEKLTEVESQNERKQKAEELSDEADAEIKFLNEKILETEDASNILEEVKLDQVTVTQEKPLNRLQNEPLSKTKTSEDDTTNVEETTDMLKHKKKSFSKKEIAESCVVETESKTKEEKEKVTGKENETKKDQTDSKKSHSEDVKQQVEDQEPRKANADLENVELKLNEELTQRPKSDDSQNKTAVTLPDGKQPVEQLEVTSASNKQVDTKTSGENAGKSLKSSGEQENAESKKNIEDLQRKEKMAPVDTESKDIKEDASILEQKVEHSENTAFIEKQITQVNKEGEEKTKLSQIIKDETRDQKEEVASKATQDVDFKQKNETLNEKSEADCKQKENQTEHAKKEQTKSNEEELNIAIQEAELKPKEKQEEKTSVMKQIHEQAQEQEQKHEVCAQEDDSSIGTQIKELKPREQEEASAKTEKAKNKKEADEINQEAESRQQEKDAYALNEKGEADLNLNEKQELTNEKTKNYKELLEKENLEVKTKEKEENVLALKEQAEVNWELKDEQEAKAIKEELANRGKQETDLIKEEEGALALRTSLDGDLKIKDKQKALAIKEKEEIEKTKQEATSKQKEEEAHAPKAKKEVDLKLQEEQEAKDRKEKEEAEVVEQEANLKLKEADARALKAKEDLKLKKERERQAEKEKGIADKVEQETDADLKIKKEQELFAIKEMENIEKAKQEANLKQKEEACSLEVKEEVDLKLKEIQEAVTVEKEASLKLKEEETRTLKTNADADFKLKEEQEALSTKEREEIEKTIQEAYLKQIEKEALVLESKKEVDLKHKEEQETKSKKEKEKAETVEQEANLKLKKKEARALTTKADADLKFKEEQEALAKKEKEKIEKTKREANLKQKEEEARVLEAKKEVDLKHKQEQEAKANKEEEEAETVKQEAKLKLKKEEARVLKIKEDADSKQKEEQEALAKQEREKIENTKQEAILKLKEEEARALKIKEDADSKLKEKQEVLAKKERKEIEKTKQEANLKPEEEEALALEAKKEVDLKHKEEQEVKAKKEAETVEQEANLKLKEKEARALTTNSDADLKFKEEQEALAKKEREEIEKTKHEANLKQKEEEARVLEAKKEVDLKHKQEQEAKAKKEKEEAETVKQEAKLKLKKEEARVLKIKEDADSKLKEEQEALAKQEREKIENTKQEAILKQKEEEARALQTNTDDDLRLKEEQEVLAKKECEELVALEAKKEVDLKHKEEQEAKAKKEKAEIVKQEANLKLKEEEAHALKIKEDADSKLKEKQEALAKKEREEIEKTKQEANLKQEEEEALALEAKKEVDLKHKEEQEVKTKKEAETVEQEANLKLKEEEARALKIKEDDSKLKEEQEALAKQEREEIEKTKQEANLKQEEEEALALEAKKEVDLKHKEEQEVKTKKEAETVEQEANLKLKEEEARALKIKEDDSKLKEEQEALAKQEREKTKKQKKEEAHTLKTNADTDLRLKEEKEALGKKEREEIEKTKQEANLKQEEEEALALEAKKEVDLKHKQEQEANAKKEKEESEKVKQKANLKLKEEEARAFKIKEDADSKLKEEQDALAIKEKENTEKIKQKGILKQKKEQEHASIKETEADLKLKEQENLAKKEREEIEKTKQEANLKQKEEEARAMEAKKEDDLKHKKEQESKAKKEKEEVETVKQEANLKLREEEARAHKIKEDADPKLKEEQEALAKKEREEIDKTRQEANLKQKEEEARALEAKEEVDLKHKKEQEAKAKIKKEETEKVNQEAESKRKVDEVHAFNEKAEADRKLKEEQEIQANKQKEEKEKIKQKDKLNRKEEESRALKDKADADFKLNVEQEALTKKEKNKTDNKEVEKIKQESELKEAEARIFKEQAEVNLKLQEEQEAQLKQTKAKAPQEMVEADHKIKEKQASLNKNEKLKRDKEEAENVKEVADLKQTKKARALKEKADTDRKIKKEKETLLQNENDNPERKQITEEKTRLKKEKAKKAMDEIDTAEKSKTEPETIELIQDQKVQVENDDEVTDNVRRKSGKKKEGSRKKKEEEQKIDIIDTETKEIMSHDVKDLTKKNCLDEILRKTSKYTERLDKSERRGDEFHIYKEDSDRQAKKENGDIKCYGKREVSHEQRYIKEYQYEPSPTGSKIEVREKPRYDDHNHRDYTMEFARPSGYRERSFEVEKTDSFPLRDHLGRNTVIHRAQNLVLDSQLRLSSPYYLDPDTSRTSEPIERRSEVRHRSKALSEARSITSDKRTGVSRDSKRKPVLSTYLTDRTAVEGSRVKLTCSVLSSSDPTVIWYKNGVLLDNKLKYKTKFMDGLITLEVLNAVPTDSAEYSCTIQNENGSVSSSANLKVYPSFEASPIPPTFTRSIRDTFHLAENELVLECRIRGQPLPTITWLKDDKSISTDSRYQAYYLADGVCRLAIEYPTPEDSGKFTCKAENSVWSDQITHIVNFTGKENRFGPNIATLEKSRFNRQALESRRPHFTNVLADYKVATGGTIGLQVEIRGATTRVEWLREGCSVTEVYRNAKTFVDQGLYTLALSDVTEKESGMYTCRAWSSQSHVDMNAAITVVQPNELNGKPAIIIGRPEKDILISVGEDVNISFRVQGEPKPKVVFMKGIRDITTNQRVCKMTSDDYVKFTLKRSVVSDAGTYCILARNAYGCDRAFVTVVVRQRASSDNLISDWTYPTDDSALSIADRKYKSVPERIPGEPSVLEGGNNWISLGWPKSEPGPSAPVLAYKVESWLLGKEGGARWMELGITPLNSFDAFNLKQGEEYHFRVTPRNRYGWGESVQTLTSIAVGLAGDRPEFSESLPGQLKILVRETANLSCSVKGAPVPEVVWMKNGHEIEDDDRRISISFNGLNCSLTIKDINIEDEARYSCEATNVHGRASTYARLAVVTDRSIWEADAKLKRERSAGVEGDYPPQFTMRLRDRRVQATFPVRLTCQVIGSPDPRITWFKDGGEITPDNRRSHFQDEHFHTLEIAPTTLEDGGVYEAMARNSSGAVSCRCSLVVDKGIRAYVAPEFCCGLEPLYRLTDGEELRISAVVEAYPSVGVTWYRDGVRLRPSRRAIMTLDRDGQIELALAAVTSRDAGVYSCTASNEVGRASTSGKVEVTGTNASRTPPVFISPDEPYSKEPMFIRKPRSSEAREGDTVIIACEVVGDPKPDVFWLRDFLKPDYYRDSSHFKRMGDGPEYRFEIPHAKLDYTGAYSVVARNQHGEVKAVISLQILAKDPSSSDETHNVRYGRVEVLPRFSKELTDLLSCDGDAVEFECRLSGNPEPYIKWFHYHELIRDCPDFETSYDEGTARLKIKQVTAEDEGTYSCEAANNLGKTTSSACLVVYPPGEPNTLSQRLRRPRAFLSAASTPRSTPRSTPARSVSRTPGPETRRLCSPARTLAPSFYTYPFNKVAEEGDPVTLQCAIKGNPAPWATWDKDGVIITPSSRITIKEKDDVLRVLEIDQVTVDDVGVYRITIENEFGRQEASARIEVITQKGKFYAGVRAVSPSPRKSMTYRSRRPSTPRQD